MKIKNLEIQNFKAIKKLKMENINNFVVIAGSNGSGKSSILHAIRFVKSIYGGYINNELNNWFNEFQINKNQSKNILLRDTKEKGFIKIEIELNEDEISYLKDNKDILVRKYLYKESNINYDFNDENERFKIIEQSEENEQKFQQYSKKYLEVLSKSSFNLGITIDKNGEVFFIPNMIMTLIFSIFEPEKLGVIDYTGPDRIYNREQSIGNFNLNFEEKKNNLRNHSLYNTNHKYQNIKNEMSNIYIKQKLTGKVENDNIIDSLKEMFAIFFDGKEFCEPDISDGKIDFIVKLSDGTTHDINDLSSGEKELLFGYLRIKLSNKENSVLLFDEPELHLNPKMIKALPHFYKKFISNNGKNQIWIITHSDTFLREIFLEESVDIYHLKPANLLNENEQNQLIEISIEEEIQSLLFDLSGNLATYVPDKNILILEGDSENKGFDSTMLTTLFPELNEKVNIISAGNKEKVKKLHNILNKASNEKKLNYSFFSIVDRDNDSFSNIDNYFAWDVYHIENYLINTKYITKVLNETLLTNVDENYVDELLKKCAEKTINKLLIHNIQNFINDKVIKDFNTNIGIGTENIASEYFNLIEKNYKKLEEQKENFFSEEKLINYEQKEREKLIESIKNGDWVKDYRGRDILKRFCDESKIGIRYDKFKNLIISSMKNDNFKPTGMKEVIDKILSN